MAELIGVGCAKCNEDIASALETMPALPGYLDTGGYIARYSGTPIPWPSPFVDGEYKDHTIASVVADDGWLLCAHRRQRGESDVRLPGPCACDSGAQEVELWRGVVDIH